MKRLSITEARNKFMKIPDEFTASQIIAVTRRNKEIMALMSWALYEGLLETIEILADPELMENLKRGLEDIRSGRTYTVDDSRKRLDL